jgi:hypothetical protein
MLCVQLVLGADEEGVECLGRPHSCGGEETVKRGRSAGFKSTFGVAGEHVRTGGVGGSGTGR